jgi:membrane-bound lytic murein transglycosylase D
MLAMGKIAKEPAKYGFTDIEPQAPLQFDQVAVPGGTRLDDLAAWTGVDPEVLSDLNPHLVRKQTPPDRRMAVRVPIGEGTRVAASVVGGVEMGFWNAE